MAPSDLKSSYLEKLKSLRIYIFRKEDDLGHTLRLNTISSKTFMGNPNAPLDLTLSDMKIQFQMQLDFEPWEVWALTIYIQKLNNFDWPLNGHRWPVKHY